MEDKLNFTNDSRSSGRTSLIVAKAIAHLLEFGYVKFKDHEGNWKDAAFYKASVLPKFKNALMSVLSIKEGTLNKNFTIKVVVSKGRCEGIEVHGVVGDKMVYQY